MNNIETIRVKHTVCKDGRPVPDKFIIHSLCKEVGEYLANHLYELPIQYSKSEDAAIEQNEIVFDLRLTLISPELLAYYESLIPVTPNPPIFKEGA